MKKLDSPFNISLCINIKYISNTDFYTLLSICMCFHKWDQKYATSSEKNDQDLPKWLPPPFAYLCLVVWDGDEGHGHGGGLDWVLKNYEKTVTVLILRSLIRSCRRFRLMLYMVLMNWRAMINWSICSIIMESIMALLTGLEVNISKYLQWKRFWRCAKVAMCTNSNTHIHMVDVSLYLDE